MNKSIALIGAVLCACALLVVPAPALAATAAHTLSLFHQAGQFDIFAPLQHAGFALAMLGAAPAFEQKDGLSADLPSDPAEAIGKIAEAWDAFTKSHTEEMKELKKGVADPVLIERLSKIEKSLEDGSEAKQKIEAAIAAERKEREDLELRLQREGIKGDGDGAKRELEIKTFNRMLAADAAERKQQPVVLDSKGYDEYKAAFDRMLRTNEAADARGGEDPFGRLRSGRRLSRHSRHVGAHRQEGLRNLADPPDRLGPGHLDRCAGRAWRTSATPAAAMPASIRPRAIPPRRRSANGGSRSTSSTPSRRPPSSCWTMRGRRRGVAGGKVGSKFGRFENAEFVTGAANKILGFAAGYTMTLDSGSGVSWGEIGYVATGVSSDFAASNPADKLHDLVGAVKVDYLANARFVTRRTVVTKMRKFKDANGLYLLQPSLVLGVPDAIMGYPLLRAEDMPALANGSKSLAFGDFREGYQIVDRQGLRVLRDPYTAKPYVKFYTTKRTGGGVVNYEAIKLLSFG
jgi:hypothetical protein